MRLRPDRGTRPLPSIRERPRRDRKGNWISVTRTYPYPTSDASRLEDKWQFGAYDAGADRCPVLAAGFADRVERLAKAVEEAQGVQAEEAEILAESRRICAVENRKIDELADAEKALFLAESSRMRKLREESERKAAAALVAAAMAVGEAGYVFKPDHDALGLELPEAPSVEHIAGREGIPLPAPDAKAGLHWLPESFLTGIVGCFLGLSLFSMFGLVHLKDIAGNDPWQLITAASVGLAAAVLGGKGLKNAAVPAAERSARGTPLLREAAVLLSVAAAFVVAHQVSDGAAMARSAGLRSAAGLGAPSPFSIAVAASALGFSYVVYSASSGFRIGRAPAAAARIRFLSDEAHERARREWPDERRSAALAAVSVALALRAEVRDLRDRERASSELHAATVKGLTSQKKTLPEAVSDVAADRIDVASEAARGAQRMVDEWEERLGSALGEPVSSWYWWWPWSYRRSRRWRAARASK